MNPISFLLNKILSWWHEHQENEKWKSFYAKLDRNGAGRFTKKRYIQDVNRMAKVERKKK